MEYNVSDFDIIYLSFDEPRCEEQYANLLSKWPWVKRVHGVKGFDNAHKACAEISNTDRFITVDGDNIVDPKFFEEKIEIPETDENFVYSWAAKNAINDLVYGNGGLKCWPVDYVKHMKTHENAEEDNSTVDFCWDTKYIQFEDIFCTTYPNGSPLQAFRAGFREGVKMTLDRGNKVTLKEFDDNKLWHGNLKRLEIWCSVGSDVENGLWAMYGARYGTYMTNLTDWNHDEIADFGWFDDFWNSEIVDKFKTDNNKYYCPYTDFCWSHDKLWEETKSLGEIIRRTMGLHIADLNESDSRFFKNVYVAPSRKGYS